MEFRRKIYTRGSSYETTIPMPLLFSIDKGKKYTAIFVFEPESGKWVIRIEEETASKKLADSEKRFSEKTRNR
jgi:hypothetical protein